jgi:peptidoglycan hydrolase CwlO-like protein
MKKLLITAAIILTAPSYTCITHASQAQTASTEKNLTAESLDKIIYDSFYKYVSKNTPFFEVDHGIQENIKNNNVAGILELFFQAIDRAIKSSGGYDRAAHREIDTLEKSEDDLKKQVQILNNKVEMLTTQVLNMNEALKDNKTLQTQPKYGGKK